MKRYSCPNCGANDFKEIKGFRLCNFCGTKSLIEKEDLPINDVAIIKSNIVSPVALDSDIKSLLIKCKQDPKNAKKYANLILDIDPDNPEALNYLR